jgi:glyoxylase-like metal-dependent hydrolase (beta-lactamase superfamily II)
MEEARMTDISRRTAIQVLAAAGLTPALLRSAPNDPKASERPGPPGRFLKEIRDGLYWLSDGAYNTMFLVSLQGVIAVDPLPTLGRRYLESVAKVTDRPVTHVVYSHEHLDHIGAADVFPKSAAIVAHTETAAILAQRKDPRRPPPTTTFADRFVLNVGDQTLDLDYRGVNHSPGNLFIYAPKQRVLMLVDVVYPGYVPYPGLGVAADVPGYIEAHRQALSYDFSEFIGGHVDRVGSRADVERSLEFALDLKRASEEALAERPFPAFLAEHPEQAAQSTWFAHDDYESDRVERCYRQMFPKWSPILRGVERSLRSHCRTMIVALAIQMPPGRSEPAQKEGLS